MNKKTFSQRTGIWLVGLGSCGLVSATELVYTPINPSFGGNPLNGTWLLNNAQAQNDYDDPDLKNRSAIAGTSALERFTSQLQSRLLGQLLDNISTGNTGSLSTDSFIVNVIDDSGALSIEVTDRVTGEISEIQVNGLNP
ncbi:curli production assembly protein CsgF [Pseudomonas prosekii]|jgi:curli production assembly/transport component CsgF|uniref:Curli production assembly/transport component CsgF n=1 Tax=Pseudomonas prosekii TaxID=1148509 RepID=A0A2U2D106_9PSED|nr:MULTISPECIES: curli assembly protein CsgF [Pseudomonas]PWE37688.1 curli production assembly protein CsgF [Pseudomonas prosekii]PWE39509.1 curli production assembly protein CsgF [Pseudomonas prosekii]RLU04983.1 curli production assembly protein CsgF [Pseudomonas prosekii]RLU11671.1 curli production assembly protein CsgF [Pseudomonas prosekii]TWD50374.1 curli production assembly/transport component CsgF [Pseudomonas sp. SJZ131]